MDPATHRWKRAGGSAVPGNEPQHHIPNEMDRDALAGALRKSGNAVADDVADDMHGLAKSHGTHEAAKYLLHAAYDGPGSKVHEVAEHLRMGRHGKAVAIAAGKHSEPIREYAPPAEALKAKSRGDDKTLDMFGGGMPAAAPKPATPAPGLMEPRKGEAKAKEHDAQRQAHLDAAAGLSGSPLGSPGHALHSDHMHAANMHGLAAKEHRGFADDGVKNAASAKARVASAQVGTAAPAKQRPSAPKPAPAGDDETHATVRKAQELMEVGHPSPFGRSWAAHSKATIDAAHREAFPHKYGAGDPTHGGHLVAQKVTDKAGHQTTRYKKTGEAAHPLAHLQKLQPGDEAMAGSVRIHASTPIGHGTVPHLYDTEAGRELGPRDDPKTLDKIAEHIKKPRDTIPGTKESIRKMMAAQTGAEKRPAFAEPPDDNDPPHMRTPFWQGHKAGHRHGTATGSASGAGAKAPTNPHAKGSDDHGQWAEGFGQGMRESGAAGRAEVAPAPSPAGKRPVFADKYEPQAGAEQKTQAAPDAPVARRDGETWDDVSKRHQDIAATHKANGDLRAWVNELDKANAPKAAAAHLDKVATNTHVLQHIADNGLKPNGMNKHTLSVVQAMAKERFHGSGPSQPQAPDRAASESAQAGTTGGADKAHADARAEHEAAVRAFTTTRNIQPVMDAQSKKFKTGMDAASRGIGGYTPRQLQKRHEAAAEYAKSKDERLAHRLAASAWSGVWDTDAYRQGAIDKHNAAVTMSGHDTHSFMGAELAKLTGQGKPARK